MGSTHAAQHSGRPLCRNLASLLLSRNLPLCYRYTRLALRLNPPPTLAVSCVKTLLCASMQAERLSVENRVSWLMPYNPAYVHAFNPLPLSPLAISSLPSLPPAVAKPASPAPRAASPSAPALPRTSTAPVMAVGSMAIRLLSCQRLLRLESHALHLRPSAKYP